jgi:PE-PPE domain
MATTVFLLDGLGWTGILGSIDIAKRLGAYPNRLVQVPYMNWLGNYLPGITAAAGTLDDYLNDPFYADDDKVVVGISMGSQVSLKWQRDYGPDSTLPGSGPGKLSFLHLACPENRFTGVSYIAPEVYGGGYGGLGLPAEGTDYDTHFFVRQYDGVGDYPNVDNPNDIAIYNAVLGMGLVHLNYFDADLDADDNYTYVDAEHPGAGEVRYTWALTYPLPWVSPIELPTPPRTVIPPTVGKGIRADLIGVYPGPLVPVGKGVVFAMLPPNRQRDSTEQLDDAWRSIIEAAYDRPVEIPDP